MLAGGEGTRLRPLTLERPKPVLPLLGRPLLAYVLERLAEAGVTRVIFGCGYLPDPIQACFGDRALGLELEYVVEPRPMGTAGGIRHAARGRVSETFLALNGDILADAPLADLVAAHRATSAVATIALTPVEDPSRYGLVRTQPDGSVLGFLEKPEPAQIDTNLINAGAYVLEREVLDSLEREVNVSIEREVFPRLVGDGLYAFPQQGYWLDIGTPATYLQATFDILERTVATTVGDRLGTSYLEVAGDVEAEGRIIPPALAGSGCRVAAGARVGSQAVLGQGVRIGADTIVESAVVLNGAEVGPGCTLRYCIIGPGARVGANTVVEGGVVLGEGVTVGADNVLRAGARIFPGVELPDSAILF